MERMAPGTNRLHPEQALHLFKISRSASLGDLNRAYRALANKYHPDRHPDREAWAHQAMTKINLAYDTAVDYLGALRYEEIEQRLDRQIKAHDDFMAVFTIVADRVLDAMFTYYQYGLDNTHQRASGTPRMRYRRAVKNLVAAIDRLNELRAPNPVDAQTRSTFTTFAHSFLRCIQLTRVLSPSSPSAERLAYRHYHQGSVALDSAIRRTFFKAELSRPHEMASPQNLSVGLNEFMTLMTKFSRSSWVTETALKLHLLDSFRDVLKLAERYEALGL
ncbi:MAG: J domain-containing protein [Spirochaetaceae bacterium]|nr:MAG: J domain-containing protein [Spirochaetaceae bacterium]